VPKNLNVRDVPTPISFSFQIFICAIPPTEQVFNVIDPTAAGFSLTANRIGCATPKLLAFGYILNPIATSGIVTLAIVVVNEPVSELPIQVALVKHEYPLTFGDALIYGKINDLFAICADFVISILLQFVFSTRNPTSYPMPRQ